MSKRRKKYQPKKALFSNEAAKGRPVELTRSPDGRYPTRRGLQSVYTGAPLKRRGGLRHP